ncbi:hypothetical protein [Sulfitobacter sp. 1A15299]|uniref:hypothetical protein n=1 Tax=Sulfitobacter sp. 1A15299 TaxID=3368598 RepID=UPI0037459E05
MVHPEGAPGLLKAFCTARGLSPVPEGRAAELLTSELHKGYKAYISAALEHIASYDQIDIAEQHPTLSSPLTPKEPDAEDTPTLKAVLGHYFEEMKRTNASAEKTLKEKHEALGLMTDLVASKPLAQLSKADAQKVKADLFKLPKNKNKNPQTRDLTLREMLNHPSAERIGARTMNVYLGHMQHFFGWGPVPGRGVTSGSAFGGVRALHEAP